MTATREKAYVTYPHLWTFLIAVLGLSCSVTLFVWTQHADHPHKDAVHRRELDRFYSEFKDFRKELAADGRERKSDVKEILARIRALETKKGPR